MRKLLILLVALLSVLSISWATPKHESKQKIQVLYSLIARHGNFYQDKSGHYHLYLKEADPALTQFTDRPVRRADLIATQTFITDWSKGNDSFASNPPNVDVVGLDDYNHKIFDHVVELSKPHYGANNQDITFDVTPITKMRLPRDVHMNVVALFIDGHWTGIGGF